MFQTEIIIFIQSFASNLWTSFFKFWTETGYPTWILTLMIVVLFGIRFKEGLILMHAVLWRALITNYLKELFALPRPANVDLNVKLLGEDYSNPTPFESKGAEKFFGRLPGDVIETLRAKPIDSWGFPSGHTSNAATQWGLIFMIFRKVWVRIIAVAAIVFIPLSRMYLGRHFLADILGGYLIGFIVAFVFYNFVYKNNWLKTLFLSKLSQFQRDRKVLALFFYLFILPFLFLFLPKVNSEWVAFLLGLNLAFLLLWIRGIPKDSGTIVQRGARVVIAFIFYLGINQGLEKISDLLFESEPSLVLFIRMGLTALLLLWGSAELCIKLRLFKRGLSLVQ